jgi:phosphoribosylaminoimidazole (AIR) synthetase
MKTFNCGVGFCLIVKKKNVARIKKVFTKEFMPYQIGFVSNKFKKKKVILLNALKW